MKKCFSLFLVLVMLLACGGAAVAEDLSVQVIGGPDVAATPMSLDDVQLGATYTIDGYAKIMPREFAFVDFFAQFNDDADYNSANYSNKNYWAVYYEEGALNGKNADYYKQASWKDSGENAEFMTFMMDVTNIQKKGFKFMEDTTVKVVYAEEYEYAGWMRQINYDYNKNVYRWNASTTGFKTAVISPKNEEEIGMMYKGTYVIGATLPNAIVEDKSSPLQLVITMGGNEIVYNVRK